MMLFDSHAHLDDNRFDADRETVIKRAFAEGLKGILNAGACMESSARAIALAEEYEAIYASVGIHPHSASEAKEADYDQLLRWCEHPKVVAVGEIGLDYYYDHSPREVQQQVLIRQLEVAQQAKMPVIIHDREAHGDITRIVRERAKQLTGVLHCFSGSVEMAREFVEMGFYISIAGPLTYQKAAKLPEVVKDIPLKHLLIETDCPYLTPHPYRGRRNEPAHVQFIAEKIAELRGISPEAVAQATTENAQRLFNIK